MATLKRPNNSIIQAELKERYWTPSLNNAVEKLEFERKFMVVMRNSAAIRKACPVIGDGLYVNNDMFNAIAFVYEELLRKSLISEINENDQCFIVRAVRGTNTQVITNWSIHSYGLAVDENSKNNILGLTYKQLLDKRLKPLSDSFVNVFRQAGFFCGADFTRPDRMHFEYLAHLDCVKKFNS